MRYHLAPLYCRPWTLNGISPRLIESHYENNYGAALNRLNAISEEIEQLDLGKTADQTLARLKRDEMAALNSTLLHELYFASLGGDGRVLPDDVASAIANDFGSGRSLASGICRHCEWSGRCSGWVLLTYVPRDSRLINQIASEHDQGIAGSVPILASHVRARVTISNSAPTQAPTSPHSCATSIGPRSSSDTKMQSRLRHLAAWNRSNLRRPSISVEEVSAMLKSGTPVQIIDTRPKHYSSKAQDIMEEPSGVIRNVWMTGWYPFKDRTRRHLLCVWHIHIGCETASTLRKAGFDARYMSGGHLHGKQSKVR